MLLWMGSSSLSSPVLIQGPVWDGFTGSGGLVGRTTESGGAVYTLERYTGTGDPTNISPSGTVVSTGTGNPQQGFAVINRTADTIRVRRRGNTLTYLGGSSNNYNGADHITATAGSGLGRWLTANFSTTTQVLTDIALRSYNQSSAATVMGTATAQVMAAPGDAISVQYAGLSGGSPTGVVYHNGARMTGTNAIVTATNPITNNYGFRGGLNLNADEIMVGDPATDRFIELIAPGHNVGARNNGDLDMVVYFRCSIDAPAVGDLKYSFLNATTLAPITGHDQQPLTNLQTNVTTGLLDTSESGYVLCKATTGLLASADYPAAGIVVEIRRNDVTVGSVAVARSGIIHRSVNLMLVGQSLTQQMWSAAGTAGSSAPSPAPTDDWLIDATSAYDASNLNTTPNNLPRVRRFRTSGATDASPNKQMAGILQSLTSRAAGIGMGGLGATLQVQRNDPAANPDYHPRLLIGAAFMFCRPNYVADTGGQFELQVPTTGGYYADFAACVADYENQVDIEQDKIDALCGAIQRMMVPIGSVLTASDTDTQTLRRLQAVEMVANQPSRYVRGPYVTDCYRNITSDFVTNPTDSYHLSQATLSFGTAPVVTHLNSGYGVQARRIARRAAFLMGLAATDCNGPIMLSAVKASATTIEVTFDPNGGTLNFRNGAYLGDYRGGLDFLTVADSNDFNTANAIFPTNCTVTGNVATFTFASIPGGTIYVCAARGARPFHRDLNAYTLDNGSGVVGGSTAVCLDPPTRASMICSDYSGNDFNGATYWVPVQSYFNTSGASGTDYVTAV